MRIKENRLYVLVHKNLGKKTNRKYLIDKNRVFCRKEAHNYYNYTVSYLLTSYIQNKDVVV